MAKTRALRLTEEDEALISEFLKANPIFDFSALARTAIRQFVANPRLDLRPVQLSPNHQNQTTNSDFKSEESNV